MSSILPGIRKCSHHGRSFQSFRLDSLLRSTHSAFSTALSQRHVRMEGSKLDVHRGMYPTPGDGHEFRMNIFGLLYSTDDIMALQNCIWTSSSFLPRQPARPLQKHHLDGAFSSLCDLSDIAGEMAVERMDGAPGLLAKNELRQAVASTLDDSHFCAAMDLLQAFKTEKHASRKQALGQAVSDLAFWSQWLLRGVLFEGKLHWQLYCQDAVRAPLSKIAFAANAALGRHQIEFVYDDYTLKAAKFPEDFDMEADVDYDDPKSIVDAVASIETPVGFNSVKGGSPEHNFRHVHSLMEYQMKRAFVGGDKILAGDAGGWDDVVEAARRANRVFQTMLRNTPPESYPKIRLPIKGVRGACGSVYHKHGVFYEGVGTESYVLEDGSRISGVYIDDEWGQTGANSSMYKWFDLFCGVTNARQAYSADPIALSKMAEVFDGRLDSGQLGNNPIDSMQRAFDLFTRPPLHMRLLVRTDQNLRQILGTNKQDPTVLLQQLRLAYWVAQHRMTHGKYVLASIYQTEPVGGQSRAEGTGGSTPPFLKSFLDQTLHPGRGYIIQLLMQQDGLTKKQLQETYQYAREFDEFEATMEKVRRKGQELEYDENVSNAHA